MVILQAQQIRKDLYIQNRTLTILESVSLSVNAGESIALLGASGSGKTTLLGLLAGLDLPTQGQIEILGQSMIDLDEDSRAQFRLGKIGFVFQSFDLLPHFTALENVMLPLELANKKDAKSRAVALLKQVGLGDRLDHYPSQLSGGEQERVAIARAYVVEPKILFADEPTGSLDEQSGEVVLKMLFDLNAQKGTTLIFVTHDPQIAQRCQREYKLEHGKLHELSKT